MLRKLTAVIALFSALLMFQSGVLYAAMVTGQIKSISKKAQTIQIKDAKANKTYVIKLGKATRFNHAKSIKDFIVNDKVVVDYQPGSPAVSIKRVMIKISPKRLISTTNLVKLMRSRQQFTIIDSRPAGRYQEGHIPGSISVPVSNMKNMWNKLPVNKNRVLVFYCGGPT